MQSKLEMPQKSISNDEELHYIKIKDSDQPSGI